MEVNPNYRTPITTFILLALVVVTIAIYPSITHRSVQQSPVVPTMDDDPILGNENAPITIIEFADYQSPFSRKFYTESFTKLKEEYIDTGKVVFVLRDFPLTDHVSAQVAAEAAECVRVQGGDNAYWRMHSRLFEKQNILDGGSPQSQVTQTVSFSQTEVENWAAELGYDISSCLQQHEFTQEVEDDVNDGLAAGVHDVPAFFINDRFISGAQSYNLLKAAIEKELQSS
jgi:protein-disulfide isomerase